MCRTSSREELSESANSDMNETAIRTPPCLELDD